MQRVLTLFLIIALPVLLTGCTKATWMGFYYPKGDYYNEVISPVFSTKDECLNWAYSQVTYDTDEYECGKNCRLSESGIIYYCDETVE